VQRLAAATFRRANLAGVVVGRTGRRGERALEKLASGGGALPP